MGDWTFITNHGAVLASIAEHGRITAREIASILGITERSVHRIITDLEQAGYIVKERASRTNSYLVDPSLSLRRPETAEVPVGDLLQVLRPMMRRGEDDESDADITPSGTLS